MSKKDRQYPDARAKEKRDQEPPAAQFLKTPGLVAADLGKSGRKVGGFQSTRFSENSLETSENLMTRQPKFQKKKSLKESFSPGPSEWDCPRCNHLITQ